MRARFVSADVDDIELVKVFVNRNRCMGWGVCYSHAPEIYQTDSEGYSVVPKSQVDASLLEKAMCC